MKLIKKIIAIVLVLATVFCTAAMAETANGGRKLIATGNCNLRKGPGLEYKVITVIHTNDTVIQIGEEWEIDSRNVVWYKVTTKNGKTGWASSVYLHESRKDIAKVKTTGNVNLRNENSRNGKILTVVPKGQIVKCTNAMRDADGVMWFLVTYAGKVGWISSKYATEI